MAARLRRLNQTSHIRRDAVHSIFVLKKMTDLGGRATIARLREYMTHGELRNALVTLLHKKFVREDGNYLIVTPLGKDEAAYQIELDSPQKPNKKEPEKSPEIVTPRIKVFKPLRINSRLSGPIRDGKDDHLKLPSLMGGVRKLPSGEVIG